MDEDEFKEAQLSWAMATHLSSLLGAVGVPFGNILGPLCIWLVKKHEFPAVDIQGKESLNFQISMTIYLFAAGFLFGIFFHLVIALIAMITIIIVDIIFVIQAAMKISNEKPHRYPFTFRFLK